MRVTIKTGDVFMVKNKQTKKYLQYITNDITQLNSDVIRVFETEYPIDENPNLDLIVQDNIQFYAHCVTKFGVKLGSWDKIGNCSDVGDINNIMFKTSSDYGNKPKAKSENWYIWKINKERQFVGKLHEENQKAHIGLVFDPLSINDEIRDCKGFPFYPSF